MRPYQVLQKIGFVVTLLTMVLLPVFYLPVTADYYEFNKNFLLFGSTIILLLVLTVSFVLERQVKLVRSPLGLPILLVAVSWIVSALLRSPNRVDAFLLPGQAGTILVLALFFTCAINLIRARRELELSILGLVGSLAVLGLISALWSSGLAARFINVPYLKNDLWTPSGNPFTTLVALISGLPILVILLAKEKKFTPKFLFLVVCLVAIVGGSGLLSYRLFRPENRPLFLAQKTSWAIALESVKTSPLLGTGPGTFLYNFTQYRPVTHNLSREWGVRFANSSNYYLQIMSTIGLVGFAAYLFLVARTYLILAKTARGSQNSESGPTRVLALAAVSSATFIFASQLFLPAGVLTQALSFIFLVLTVVALKQANSPMVVEANIDIVAGTSTGYRSPLLPWGLLVLALALVIPSLYLAGRAYAGEVLFQDALVAASANDGKKTYDTLLSAMRTNPYRDRYRVMYSQTNLLLANSIAGSENPSENDRRTITQLIQQSIREAKNGVALNPRSVVNVENLATIYRNLLNLAQGADGWVIASYRQAIFLDPTNPNLRISLGGVLFTLKRYDEALGFFQQAIDLKPDLANAYYNLAITYREKADYQRSAAALEKVLSLVDKASDDYTKASQDLEEVKARLGTTQTTLPTATNPPTLTTPPPLPSPNVSPIPLDQSLAPDTPASPSSQP